MLELAFVGRFMRLRRPLLAALLLMAAGGCSTTGGETWGGTRPKSPVMAVQLAETQVDPGESVMARVDTGRASGSERWLEISYNRAGRPYVSTPLRVWVRVPKQHRYSDSFSIGVRDSATPGQTVDVRAKLIGEGGGPLATLMIGRTHGFAESRKGPVKMFGDVPVHIYVTGESPTVPVDTPTTLTLDMGPDPNEGNRDVTITYDPPGGATGPYQQTVPHHQSTKSFEITPKAVGLLEVSAKRNNLGAYIELTVVE